MASLDSMVMPGGALVMEILDQHYDHQAAAVQVGLVVQL